MSFRLYSRLYYYLAFHKRFLFLPCFSWLLLTSNFCLYFLGALFSHKYFCYGFCLCLHLWRKHFASHNFSSIKQCFYLQGIHTNQCFSRESFLYKCVVVRSQAQNKLTQCFTCSSGLEMSRIEIRWHGAVIYRLTDSRDNVIILMRLTQAIHHSSRKLFPSRFCLCYRPEIQ